jgi:hypothetical protein
VSSFLVENHNFYLQKKGLTNIFDVSICDNNRNVTINYKESTVQIFIKPLGKCGNDSERTEIRDQRKD